MTVLRDASAPAWWPRIKAPRNSPTVRWVAVLAVVIGVTLTAPASTVDREGRAPAAATYAYPLRCLSVAIALHDPRFARAGFDRAVRCVPVQ